VWTPTARKPFRAYYDPAGKRRPAPRTDVVVSPHGEYWSSAEAVVSPDGRHALLHPVFNSPDRTETVWDLATGKQVKAHWRPTAGPESESKLDYDSDPIWVDNTHLIATEIVCVPDCEQIRGGIPDEWLQWRYVLVDYKDLKAVPPHRLHERRLALR
jgi:hypothetical protein